MEDSWYWSYVGDRPDETAQVRRRVRRFLEAQADAERSDLDGAELVVGELLANAVRHGAPPYGVCIDWQYDPPILCILDHGEGMVPVYAAPEPLSEGGRGLLIVRALADEVIVDTSSVDRQGTRVVVALPVQRAA